MIPHIVGEIVDRIKKAGEGKDVLIVEIGGTVGDIEGLPFLEAIRALRVEVGKKRALNIHLTLVPFIKVAGELKTKPTQHSVGELRRIGISPDIIICRSEMPLNRELKDKIAASCGVEKNCVIESLDSASIYQIPLSFLKQDILVPIAENLGFGELKPDMANWDSLVKRIIAPTNETTIAFVGKYIDLKESYKSLTEGIIHAGANLDARVNLRWIDSEKIEESNVNELLKDVDGILVAGGFGERGVLGKMQAIKFARENKIPYLGICLGMQLAMIEFARDVLGLEDANSMEFNKECKNPIIYLIDSFIDAHGKKQIRTHTSPLGGTMRLGAYNCDIKPKTLLAEIYGNAKSVKERHRHRYEANPKYKEIFEKAGLIVSGESDGLVEAIELKGHPWFVGVQCHPEFTSRLTRPNPVILGFIKASLANHVK